MVIIRYQLLPLRYDISLRESQKLIKYKLCLMELWDWFCYGAGDRCLVFRSLNSRSRLSIIELGFESWLVVSNLGQVLLLYIAPGQLDSAV